MTEFKPGDRVRVTYDTTLTYVGTDKVTVPHPTDDRCSTVLPLSALTLLPDPLPTTPESVIRVTETNLSHLLPGSYLLGSDGYWHDSQGSDIDPRHIQEYAARWEVLYDAAEG